MTLVPNVKSFVFFFPSGNPLTSIDCPCILLTNFISWMFIDCDRKCKWKYRIEVYLLFHCIVIKQKNDHFHLTQNLHSLEKYLRKRWRNSLCNIVQISYFVFIPKINEGILPLTSRMLILNRKAVAYIPW